MREIKFRAWDKRYKQMRILSLSERLVSEELIVAGTKNTLHRNEELSDWMQYTGLKDKNGVEIYESDLIRAYYPTTGKYITGEVLFDTEQFIGYKIDNTRMSACTDFKVIGNKYES